MSDDGRHASHQPRFASRGRAPLSDQRGTGRRRDHGRDHGAAAARDAGRRDHRTGHGSAPPAATSRGRYALDPAAVPAVLLRPASTRREYLVPSSVILAGVLAVVAVAVTLNWGMRPAPTQPVVPPPVIGAPLAPADEWNVPTPGAVATVGPTDRPSTSPPDDAAGRDGAAPPPSRSKATAPPANALAISRTSVPRTVNLSAEGRRDWVHWGLSGTFSLERRKAGGFAILEGTPSSPRHRHALSAQRFVWQDGSAVPATSGTPSGIRTCGAGNGFTITVPSASRYRTLRLYVGVADGTGRLTAKLSTGGSAVRGVLHHGAGLGTAVFTLTYRSARKGVLKIAWVTERSDKRTCSGVALQAATLR